MANEITSTVSLSLAKGSLSVNRSATNRVTMNGTTYAAGAASIPTTAAGTALAMGSVATAGFGFFRNADATNYVEIGIQTGGVFHALVKLLAGESSQFRLGTNAPYARANTAAVVLDYTIAEA